MKIRKIRVSITADDLRCHAHSYKKPYMTGVMSIALIANLLSDPQFN
jgi:hypothetical protein